MQEKYTPAAVEALVQAYWESGDAFRVVEHALNSSGKPKPKFYACSMLPYPSGKLHMGHVRNYTINDVMARYMRMKGFNVLMPMGWDAFGLPAENAAIEHGVAPSAWTRGNIAEMKAQMRPLGLSIDWSRELSACDPDYYKWNQWMFLRMLEKGIAYRKTQVVNWDPVDQTVLANEQVIDGRGWRTNALIERREIPGYYLKITDYADDLLDTVVHHLPGWPERVRAMQENWIGRSEGVRFAFTHDIRDGAGRLIDDGRMYVFTTRADTIMGVTFCAVAPEHPLAVRAAEMRPAVQAFLEEARRGGTTEAELAQREKAGVDTGLVVTHPLSGASVPVWVGNYVLMSYGDGAVMGVPAHDERDFAFARKYGLTIAPVIGRPDRAYDTTAWQEWYGDKAGGACINSGALDGLAYLAAVEAVAAQLIARQLGEKKVTYRLRDWSISRQRYWGTPIPIIHCPGCGPVPVPEADLPVLLPEDLLPDGSSNPLTRDERFLACTCPQCGAAGRRETDTMDTFVDSAWYYMRYCCPGSDSAMIDARAGYWMPMDQYIGGIEHAVLHLLYARFWTRVMRDLGLVDFKEPFTRLFTQGMLLNESFYREDESGKKQWLYPSDVEIDLDDKGKPIGARSRADGLPVLLGGVEKMAKSKKNVVEPGDIVSRYGADTARLFSMFASPPELSAIWSDSSVAGQYRFVESLWSLCRALREPLAPLIAAGALASSPRAAAAREARREIHLHLRQISEDFERLKYNTVVSGAMKMRNVLDDVRRADALAAPDMPAVIAEGLSILLRVLSPVAPHVTHVLWDELGFAAHGGLLDAPWPLVDPAALVQDEIELVIQVNGKLRGKIRVASGADNQVIEAQALAEENVQKFLLGPVKTIKIVPGRLVNIVI